MLFHGPNFFLKGPFMKHITLLTFSLLSTSVFAGNLCSKYESYPRYMKAIATVAESQNKTLDAFCTNPRVLDIEAQPSRLIARDGEVIPHVRVQEHFEFDSCLYMVNENNYTISQSRCYSGM